MSDAPADDESVGLRCAVCHAGIGADDVGSVCPGCGTRLHEECAAELGRCPTIGCAHGAAMPPVADEKKATPPGFVLYSPNQVFIASLVLSFFGGAALLAVNAWRLRRRAVAALAVGLSSMVLVTLIFFSSAVPEDSLSTSRVWALVAAIAMRFVAGASQGGAYQAHLGQGGRRGSTWVALGVALLATLSLLAPAFAVYVALDVTLPDAIYLRVEAEDDAAAERLCTVRVLMAPDDHWAWSTRGYVRTRQGRHEEALLDHDRALRLAPTEALYRARRAHTQLEQGDARGALADLDRAVARDPDDAWSWVLRGTAHERLGDPLAALGDYEQALRLEHDHPFALERRAALSASE